MNKFLGIFIAMFLCLPILADIIEDEVAAALSTKQPKVEVYKNYNFESTKRVPISLKIIEPIKSKTDKIYMTNEIYFLSFIIIGVILLITKNYLLGIAQLALTAIIFILNLIF